MLVQPAPKVEQVRQVWLAVSSLKSTFPQKPSLLSLLQSSASGLLASLLPLLMPAPLLLVLPLLLPLSPSWLLLLY